VAAAAAAGALLSACGSPSADLFLVHRSGTDRNANLTMLVADDGSVTCNGRQHPLPAKELLAARELARELGDQAQLDLALPARPGSVLRYHVQVQQGTVSFADTSRPLPGDFTRLEQFTKDVAEGICGIGRQ
jgi:hypothetical protein